MRALVVVAFHEDGTQKSFELRGKQGRMRRLRRLARKLMRRVPSDDLPTLRSAPPRPVDRDPEAIFVPSRLWPRTGM